jgi:Membrane domain of glycerophosphoryl diester phosphodiesterase
MSWTIESALRTTFTLVRDNFGPFFAATLAFTAPSLLVDLVGGGLLISLVVGFITNVLVSISLTVGAIQAMAGKRPDFATLMRQANRPRSSTLILLGIVQSVVICLGFTLLVPGFWVLALWMVAMPAMLVEHKGVGDALNRSAELTRERRWRVLGTFVAGCLLAGVPLALVDFLLDRLIGFDEASAGYYILGWLTGAALATVLGSLPAVLYVLLRGEKEGVTLPQIAAALD